MESLFVKYGCHSLRYLFGPALVVLHLASEPEVWKQIFRIKVSVNDLAIKSFVKYRCHPVRFFKCLGFAGAALFPLDCQHFFNRNFLSVAGWGKFLFSEV